MVFVVDGTTVGTGVVHVGRSNWRRRGGGQARSRAPGLVAVPPGGGGGMAGLVVLRVRRAHLRLYTRETVIIKAHSHKLSDWLNGFPNFLVSYSIRPFSICRI
jgi:hypothetical protein